MCANVGSMISISSHASSYPIVGYDIAYDSDACKEFLLTNSNGNTFDVFKERAFKNGLEDQWIKLISIFQTRAPYTPSMPPEQGLEIMQKMVIKYIESKGEVDTIVKPYVWLISFPLVSAHNSPITSEALKASNVWNEMALDQAKVDSILQEIDSNSKGDFYFVAKELNMWIAKFKDAPNGQTCEVVKQIFNKLTQLLPPTNRENPYDLTPDSIFTFFSDFRDARKYRKHLDICWLKLLSLPPKIM